MRARLGAPGLVASWLGFIVLLTSVPAGAPASAQERDRLRISAGDAGSSAVELLRHRGFPAVGVDVLGTAGWRVEPVEGDGYRATLPDGPTMEIRPGLPYVRLGPDWIQLVDAPYLADGVLQLPLQLVTDLLPDRFPERYAATDSRELRILEEDLWRAGLETGADREVSGAEGSGSPGIQPANPEVQQDDGVRVVIIDAGHGGVDPGALGRRRTREKDVTLAVALALERELRGDPNLEVHLTRDEDVLVPLWERGEIATRLKGDRPGVFLSIHANSVTQRSVRGVETYFLSEARTEHEARVAALENSAMELERARPSGPGEGELGAIISELLNLDFQHWSSDLAAAIQGELAGVHPGPDRGVKQGPMAVLTNAMMPSVLIEVGFITNSEEEALISDPGFHADAARAVARAVRDFFGRYPPGGTPKSPPR